ncbi:MAG: O-antigen biosynthesis protein WbqP [Clostridium butyricum]|nr:O-antigen biosynthesis protein WbqP [Petroclostridium sp.]MDK2830226.1 O-antigen biosynthesis protein WbqP [Clostridium butyricum]
MYKNYIKRFLDFLLSTLGIVILSPIFIIISVLIKIDDPGPIFFKQKRIGKDKEGKIQYFMIYKYRSMKMSTPKDTPTHLLENPQQYITKVGAFLRKTSLDELPQIFNIWKGEMSIIGPRPALWNQVDLYEERAKYRANEVLPGLTGWAQINGRDELEIQKKAKLDGEYIECLSFGMDVKCFIGTIYSVLRSEGVVEGGTGELNRMINEEIKTKEMLTSIEGKKILFFAPAFFGYENKIKSKMIEMGAIVDMYDVRSVTSAKHKAILKLNPNIFNKKSVSYYEKIIEKNKSKNYDYILIIKCDMTPIVILNKLKKTFTNSKMCLYLWDSVENIPGITSKLQYFDSVYSFDLADCKQYSVLKFRPLFYSDEFQKNKITEMYKYDLSFTGTIHSDRYKIIKQIRNIAEKNNLSCFWFCYLQSKFIYYFYKVTKREFRKTTLADFDFIKMSSEEIANIVNNSRVVLDFQHPNQTGLTMRTIEMIGMNKKLITTNSSIKEYDFYNPNNIKIIERNNVNFDLDFIYQQYEPIKKEVYDKYSLGSWILEVLS